MLLCMRTTIRLEEQLLFETKAYAVRHGKTLTAVIEDALRQLLLRQKLSKKEPPTRLTTHNGGGLQPGVDLDNSAALLDLMDGIHDTN